MGILPARVPDPAATQANTLASGSPVSKQQQLYNLVNQEREGLGLSPLRLDSELSKVALGHSRDMAENDFFSHESARSGGIGERLGKAEITFAKAAENIALAPTIPDINRILFDSPPHRANLLEPDFTEIGIGVAEGEDGSLIVTQVFRRPPEAPDAVKIEGGLIRDVNSQRTRQGVVPLRRDALLQEAARANSRELARRDEIDLEILENELERQRPQFPEIHAHVFRTPTIPSLLQTPVLLAKGFKAIGLGIAFRPLGAGQPPQLDATLLLGADG